MKSTFNQVSVCFVVGLLLCTALVTNAQDEKAILKEELITERFSLVRLEDQSEKISHYRSHGNKKYANKIKHNQDKFNKMIIDEFKKHFNFTQVYFCNMSDSKKLFDDDDHSVIFDSEGNRNLDGVIISEEIYVIAVGEVIGNEHNSPFQGLTLLKHDGERLNRLQKPQKYFFKAASKIVSNGRRWDKAVQNINTYLNASN